MTRKSDSGGDGRLTMVFYRDWRDVLAALPEVERLKAYEAIMAYAFDGEMPKTIKIHNITALMILTIKRDKEKYLLIREKRIKAIKARWAKVRSNSDLDAIHMNANATVNANANATVNANANVTLSPLLPQGKESNNISRVSAEREELLRKLWSDEFDDFADKNGIHAEAMYRYGKAVLEEWETAGAPAHKSIAAATKHLLNAIRVKAEKAAAKSAASGRAGRKTRAEREAELMNGAAATAAEMMAAADERDPEQNDELF